MHQRSCRLLVDFRVLTDRSRHGIECGVYDGNLLEIRLDRLGFLCHAIAVRPTRARVEISYFEAFFKYVYARNET